MDYEDINVLDSRNLPDNAVVIATEAEPLGENDFNLFVAHSVEVVSTEDSIICIDEDETSEQLLDKDNLHTTSSPVAIPYASPDPESTALSISDKNDVDVEIVYEKKASPKEVVILENYISTNTKTKNRHRQSQNPRPSNQSDYPYSYLQEVTVETDNSLDDSISIIGSSSRAVPITPSEELLNTLQQIATESVSYQPEETPNTSVDDSISIIGSCTRVVQPTPSENQSNTLNNLRQIQATDAEKKKRKIECTICFDGPDEIEANGKNLVSTVCGHIFCSECIKTVIKTTKHCPHCRKKLTMKQFHPLYL